MTVDSVAEAAVKWVITAPKCSVPKKDVYQLLNWASQKKHVELVGVQQAGIGPYIIPGRLLSEQRVWDTERGPVHWLLIFPIKHWQPLGLLREKPHFQRPMRELLVDDGCPNSRLTWVYACIYSWMGLYTNKHNSAAPKNCRLWKILEILAGPNCSGWADDHSQVEDPKFQPGNCLNFLIPRVFEAFRLLTGCWDQENCKFDSSLAPVCCAPQKLRGLF